LTLLSHCRLKRLLDGKLPALNAYLNWLPLLPFSGLSISVTAPFVPKTVEIARPSYGYVRSFEMRSSDEAGAMLQCLLDLDVAVLRLASVSKIQMATHFMRHNQALNLMLRVSL
jgi:hypothetical protein